MPVDTGNSELIHTQLWRPGPLKYRPQWSETVLRSRHDFKQNLSYPSGCSRWIGPWTFRLVSRIRLYAGIILTTFALLDRLADNSKRIPEELVGLLWYFVRISCISLVEEVCPHDQLYVRHQQAPIHVGVVHRPPGSLRLMRVYNAVARMRMPNRHSLVPSTWLCGLIGSNPLENNVYHEPRPVSSPPMLSASWGIRTAGFPIITPGSPPVVTVLIFPYY